MVDHIARPVFKRTQNDTQGPCAKPRLQIHSRAQAVALLTGYRPQMHKSLGATPVPRKPVFMAL